MGFDPFFGAYKYLVSTSDGDEPEPDHVLVFDGLSPARAKFIPFVIQLITCEDTVYGGE